MSDKKQNLYKYVDGELVTLEPIKETEKSYYYDFEGKSVSSAIPKSTDFTKYVSPVRRVASTPELAEIFYNNLEVIENTPLYFHKYVDGKIEEYQSKFYLEKDGFLQIKDPPNGSVKYKGIKIQKFFDKVIGEGSIVRNVASRNYTSHNAEYWFSDRIESKKNLLKRWYNTLRHSANTSIQFSSIEKYQKQYDAKLEKVKHIAELFTEVSSKQKMDGYLSFVNDLDNWYRGELELAIQEQDVTDLSNPMAEIINNNQQYDN